jgi:excisionase family DNA binding protein
MRKTTQRKPQQIPKDGLLYKPWGLPFYSKPEVAYLFNCSVRSIYYFVSDGRLKTTRIGKRNLISIDELRRFSSIDHRTKVVQ